MSTIVLYTILSLTTIGVLSAIILYITAQKFKVEEDPRVGQVLSVLPGVNCGNCGYPGCANFAEACVKANDLTNLFAPWGVMLRMGQVAQVLGLTATAQAPQIAVIRCNGTKENRNQISLYDGVKTCQLAAFTFSGETGCSYGCLGFGDCVTSCQFDAIKMDEKTGLPVVLEEKCIACGACVKACPKNIIELRNKNNGKRIFVSCINKDKGAVARKACQVACIGCGKCFKECAFNAITIKDNLSYINFNKCTLCGKCVAVCPTKAIHQILCQN